MDHTAHSRRESGGELILLAQKLNMISPGGGVAAAHLQDVHHNAMDSAVGVAPDVVEGAECPDVEYCFYWKFTKEEVQCRNWRRLAQLQEASEDFVLEDF